MKIRFLAGTAACAVLLGVATPVFAASSPQFPGPAFPGPEFWHAVEDGSLDVRVRELAGPRNSMGRVKFAFPNRDGIYLHDTPVKALFDQDDRTISHGCVRLEDAQRLESWMMGGDPVAASDTPEDQVALPAPVPIYITYLTAQAEDGQLSFVDDIYGRDTEVASIR